MNLPFANAQDAVIELRRKHFPGFHVLPYNRFDVEHSQHWWLSPTSEKAAFRYGKVIFTTEDWAPDGDVFCAFNVEKGQRVAGGGNPNYLMTDDWFWSRFLELSNTPLVSAVEEAHKAIGQDLQLCVACGITAPGAKWDRVRFKIHDDQLERQDFRLGDGMLNDVVAATNIADFATAIRTHDSDKSAWYWTDVLVGLDFTLDPSGADELDQCAAMLKPFEPWMRAR